MKEDRPWGSYEVLLDADNCKVKRITVVGKNRLSYQSHEHRSETWTVVQGRAVVTLDGNDKVVHPQETIFIPQGTKHRVANGSTIVSETLGKDKTTMEDLVFIEVQHGTYFGEDDIIRYEDDYQRV